MHNFKEKTAKCTNKAIQSIWKHTYKKREYKKHKKSIHNFSYQMVDVYFLCRSKESNGTFNNAFDLDRENLENMLWFVYCETFAYSYYLLFKLAYKFEGVSAYQVVASLVRVLDDLDLININVSEKVMARGIVNSRLHIDEIISLTYQEMERAVDYEI